MGTNKLQKVEITLSDCLACSGCITSAEGVLITQQSQEELLKVFQNNAAEKLSHTDENVKFIVITLSQQPLLSLTNKYKLPVNDAAEYLTGYFKELGADLVLNTKIADDFALLESRNEFVERYNNSNLTKDSLPMLSSSCPGS